MELTQITFLQMMETLQDTLSAMEDNMSLRLNKIEQRLDSLEKVFSDPGVNCGPVPQTGNLQTIDHEALAFLSDDPMEVFEPVPSTPPAPTTPQTPALQPSTLEDDIVGEDVIRSLVTPS